MVPDCVALGAQKLLRGLERRACIQPPRGTDNLSPPGALPTAQLPEKGVSFSLPKGLSDRCPLFSLGDSPHSPSLLPFSPFPPLPFPETQHSLAVLQKISRYTVSSQLQPVALQTNLCYTRTNNHFFLGLGVWRGKKQ